MLRLGGKQKKKEYLYYLSIICKLAFSVFAAGIISLLDEDEPQLKVTVLQNSSHAVALIYRRGYAKIDL